MAKLFFRYGAMGSSKTANALMVQFNYLERGQQAILLKPSIDNRDGQNYIASRIGLKEECYVIEPNTNILEFIKKNLLQYNAIIVDEAQFLSKEQVYQLSEIVDIENVPVLCYGLRSDFQGNLFEGSMALMTMADTIEEIKTICFCGRKANYNMRLINGKPIFEGEQIQIGGNESYISVCRKHWKEHKYKL